MAPVPVPPTGIPFDPFSATLFGASLVSDIFGAANEASTARKNIKHLKSKIKELKSQKASLSESFEARGEIVTDNFGKQLNFALKDTKEQSDEALGKTGFFEHGGVERKRDSINAKVKDKFTSGLQEDLHQLEVRKQTELSSIDNAIKESKRNISTLKDSDTFLEAMF